MDTKVLLKQARLHLIELLEDAQVCLKTFLEKLLPTLPKRKDETWWEHRVLPPLSDLQRKGIRDGELGSLDLAGLLTVLIGNWNNIPGRSQKELALALHMQGEIRPAPQSVPYTAFSDPVQPAKTQFGGNHQPDSTDALVRH